MGGQGLAWAIRRQRALPRAKAARRCDDRVVERRRQWNLNSLTWPMLRAPARCPSNNACPTCSDASGRT
eukprot:488601-Alexandrium_andersonii.AAC.1